MECFFFQGRSKRDHWVEEEQEERPVKRVLTLTVHRNDLCSLHQLNTFTTIDSVNLLCLLRFLQGVYPGREQKEKRVLGQKEKRVLGQKEKRVLEQKEKRVLGQKEKRVLGQKEKQVLKQKEKRVPDQHLNQLNQLRNW